MARWLLAVLPALVIGCGDSSEPAPADPRARTITPYELTCGDLDAPGARREAIEFVADVLVAPEGQARSETVGIVRRSLRETCKLEALPGVDEPADYRPVRPVRQAVQNHFDQDAIYDR